MAVTTVTIDHLGGERYVGHNEAGDQIVIDGEEIALGVRPMEALLAALGTCTAFDVVSILAKRRTAVESYRIELEGERAEDHPRRYTKIRVRHIVSGEGIMQESLERVVTLSHEKYCSVAAPLNSEVDSDAILKYSQPEAYARYETSCRRRSFL
jgi:putative redox protein